MIKLILFLITLFLVMSCIDDSKESSVEMSYNYNQTDSLLTFNYENKSDSNFFVYYPKYAVLKKVELTNIKSGDTLETIELMPLYEKVIYGQRITPFDSISNYLNQQLESIQSHKLAPLAITAIASNSNKSVTYKLLNYDIYDSLRTNQVWVIGDYMVFGINFSDYIGSNDKVKKFYQSIFAKFEKENTSGWLPYHRNIKYIESGPIVIE